MCQEHQPLWANCQVHVPNLSTKIILPVDSIMNGSDTIYTIPLISMFLKGSNQVEMCLQFLDMSC